MCRWRLIVVASAEVVYPSAPRHNWRRYSITDASLLPMFREINVRSGTPHSRNTGRSAPRHSRYFTPIVAGYPGPDGKPESLDVPDTGERLVADRGPGAPAAAVDDGQEPATVSRPHGKRVARAAEGRRVDPGRVGRRGRTGAASGGGDPTAGPRSAALSDRDHGYRARARAADPGRHAAGVSVSDRSAGPGAASLRSILPSSAGAGRDRAVARDALPGRRRSRCRWRWSTRVCRRAHSPPTGGWRGPCGRCSHR